MTTSSLLPRKPTSSNSQTKRLSGCLAWTPQSPWKNLVKCGSSTADPFHTAAITGVVGIPKIERRPGNGRRKGSCLLLQNDLWPAFRFCAGLCSERRRYHRRRGRLYQRLHLPDAQIRWVFVFSGISRRDRRGRAFRQCKWRSHRLWSWRHRSATSVRIRCRATHDNGRLIGRMTQCLAFVVCAYSDRMPTARLTSRQVAVGQHASPCFRRLFSPVACAGNERSNRSSLFSRTRLRDSSKLDNTLVATRSDSSGGERETHSETTALLREKQESEAKTDSEGITVLPSKTFHFDSPSDDMMPTEKEETPTSENPPSDQEKAEAQTDADGQIISRTADIIVAKRPSRPSLSRLVSMKRAKDANQPATEDPIALQNTSLPESSAVPNNVTYEPVQKVIVVKRKPQPPIKRPAVLPKPTVIKRVEDVLVVQKSSASNAASQQLPPPALSNGAKAILKGKPLPRTENKPVQPPVDSKEEKSPSNSGGGRVIERPRPKSLVQRSAKRPDLPKIPRSPTRAKMDVAEVLMKRRVRLAEQDEEASREAQSEQKRLTPLDDSSVQDTPPALDKESAVDSDKAISSKNSVVQDTLG